MKVLLCDLAPKRVIFALRAVQVCVLLLAIVVWWSAKDFCRQMKCRWQNHEHLWQPYVNRDCESYPKQEIRCQQCRVLKK